MCEDIFQEWSRYMAGLKKMPDCDSLKQFIMLEFDATQHLNDTEVMSRQKMAVKKTKPILVIAKASKLYQVCNKHEQLQ